MTTLNALIDAASPYNHWALGESSGTTATDRAGSDNGTYVGSPTLGVAGAPGSDDTAVTFNGSSQYVSVANLADLESALNAETPIEVTIHFKTSSTSRGNLFGLVSDQTIVSITMNDNQGTESSGWVTVTVRDNGGSAVQRIRSNLGLNDGDWHSLRVRFDTAGTGLTYWWVDGVFTSIFSRTSAALGALDLTEAWYIGARNVRGTADQFFNGTIGSVIISPIQTAATADGIYRKAITNTDPVGTVSAATEWLTNTDTGTNYVYWTRPYLYPDTTSDANKYVFLGSTDHDSNAGARMYRGFSSSPATAPSSWTVFRPNPAADTQQETPWFVYDTGDAAPYCLFYHPALSDGAGATQASKLVRHDDVDWENGTDVGVVLPGDANIGVLALDHTGYMMVERNAADDWEAWSFTRSEAGPAGEANYGYWTSADGETWTCQNDDLDVRSMVAAGRQLVGRSLNRFVHNGTTYAIITEHPDDADTGGSDPDPGGLVVLCTMSDAQTFSAPVQVLWDPRSERLTDDLRDVRAYQDDDNPALIHLYIHNNRDTVYYATLTLPSGRNNQTGTLPTNVAGESGGNVLRGLVAA